MWSQKTKSGSVCYYERYKDPMTGKVRTATVTIRPTGKRNDRRAAEAALKAKIDDIFSLAEAPDEITMEALTKEYGLWQEKTHKPQTAKGTMQKIHRICDLLGNDTLADRLTASYVSGHLWQGSAATYNERLTRFKAMMRWAYRQDLVSDIGYLDKIQRAQDQTTREKDAEKYLDHDEIDALLSSMTVPLWKMLTEFLILTGLRIGEAIALEDEDVTPDTITVSKTFSLVTRQISTTKTATSTRSIDVQPELSALCRRISADKRRRSMEYAFRTRHFFCGDDGRRISYDNYRVYFERHAQQAVGRKLTPHALRHTHTAMLAEAGVPLETISRRLGHSDSKITKEVYMHVTARMKEKDRELMEGVRIID